MTGIIVTSPPTVELPPGNSGSGPNSLPGVTYQYAVLTIPQTWTALQTYNVGTLALNGTGGTSNVVVQETTNGPVTVRQLSYGDISGTITASQMPALTGDVTTTAGTVATTIAAGVVTNAKMANVSTATFKGRTTSGTGSPEDLTVTQATALLNAVVGDSGSGGTKGLVPAPSAGDAAAGKFLKADGTYAVPPGSGGRTVLNASRTYFVGANLGTCTITIATPAVVSLTAHGLSANDPVVFQVPQNRTVATISAANPVVVTMANTFAAGQPVSFLSTGNLPAGLVQGTTYYVIAAGLSGSQFEISATVGGSAINTTALTNTFVNGNTTVTSSAAHNLVIGQRFQYSGTSVVGVSNATDYYVLSTPSGTTYTFSATNGGSAVTPGVVTTQGTLVQVGAHYCSTVGALPTGITEGTVYYVISAGLTANAFEVSTTLAGSAVNTSGSVTGSPIYTVFTGNDANTGLAATRAAAFLTVGKAVNLANSSLDIAAQFLKIKVCDGKHIEAIRLIPLVGQPTGNNPSSNLNPILSGNTSAPSNCVLSSASGATISAIGGTYWNIEGFQITNTDGSSPGVLVDQQSWIRAGVMEFGSCNGTSGNHVVAENQSGYEPVSGNIIFASASSHAFTTWKGEYLTGGSNVHTLLGVPAFPGGFVFASRNSVQGWIGASFAGTATGGRYFALTGGGIETNGGGASFFPGNSVLGATSPAWYN